MGPGLGLKTFISQSVAFLLNFCLRSEISSRQPDILDSNLKNPTPQTLNPKLESFRRLPLNPKPALKMNANG